MDKQTIINKIDQKTGQFYSNWTIGITDNPDSRKNQHHNEGKNVNRWDQWATNSEADGREIEKYFIDRGMKGGTGGDSGASYVYIF